jgi:peptide deformylase
MSDTIVFNTEDTLKGDSYAKTYSIPLFDLVPETHSILKEVMPEFDFTNPPVNPAEFASSLVETCKKHKGYGLSANQCGFRYRVFVMGADNDYVAFFNPKIINRTGEVHMEEGCLSFPMLLLKITRPSYIEVEYQDFEGNTKKTQFTGISSRCFQHELDHMNGIVYTSLSKPLALQMALKKRNKINHLIKKMDKNMKKMEAYGNAN